MTIKFLLLISILARLLLLNLAFANLLGHFFFFSFNKFGFIVATLGFLELVLILNAILIKTKRYIQFSLTLGFVTLVLILNREYFAKGSAMDVTVLEVFTVTIILLSDYIIYKIQKAKVEH